MRNSLGEAVVAAAVVVPAAVVTEAPTPAVRVAKEIKRMESNAQEELVRLREEGIRLVLVNITLLGLIVSSQSYCALEIQGGSSRNLENN